MVNAAEADVVCPAVAAEDPYGFLGKVFLVCKDVSLCLAVAVKAFKSLNKCCGSRLVSFTVVNCIKVCLSSFDYVFGSLPSATIASTFEISLFLIAF